MLIALCCFLSRFISLLKPLPLFPPIQMSFHPIQIKHQSILFKSFFRTGLLKKDPVSTPPPQEEGDCFRVDRTASGGTLNSLWLLLGISHPGLTPPSPTLHAVHSALLHLVDISCEYILGTHRAQPHHMHSTERDMQMHSHPFSWNSFPLSCQMTKSSLHIT